MAGQIVHVSEHPVLNLVFVVAAVLLVELTTLFEQHIPKHVNTARPNEVNC